MCAEIQFNGNTINSIDDLILGKNQTIEITGVGTEQVNISHTFADNGDTVKMAQTVTEIMLSYSAGYSIGIELVGQFMLNDTDNPDIFTNTSTLADALKEREFTFDLFGCFLGVEPDEALSITPHDSQKKIAAEIDQLAAESDGWFASQVIKELAGAINNKEHSLATEILAKSKQSAIELLESKLR